MCVENQRQYSPERMNLRQVGEEEVGGGSGVDSRRGARGAGGALEEAGLCHHPEVDSNSGKLRHKLLDRRETGQQFNIYY